MFYWLLKWVLLGPLLKLVFRPQTEGVEHVPTEGPAILASNHLSYVDWMFMPLTLSRRVTFVAKAEYFTSPGVKGWFQKKFFSGAGQVPIDRSGATAAEGALKAAKRILGEGGLFGIYPEGTRSHDGRLYRGKTGVARLALETKVPVIPIAVVGTDVVAPPGKKFGAVTRPIVRFGEPLDFSRYEGLENDRFILRSITDEIMYEIMRLSGQEYVDLYATRAKALDKESKKPGTGPGETPADDPADRRIRAQSLLRMARAGSRTGLLDPVSEQVENTLFRALAVLRFVVAVYAVALNAARWREFEHPAAGWVVVGVIVVWTLVATWAYDAPRRRGLPLLVADFAVAAATLLSTPYVQSEAMLERHASTMPSFWVMPGRPRVGGAPGLARPAWPPPC